MVEGYRVGIMSADVRRSALGAKPDDIRAPAALIRSRKSTLRGTADRV
jgi:hypothetical protein